MVGAFPHIHWNGATSFLYEWVFPDYGEDPNRHNYWSLPELHGSCPARDYRCDYRGNHALGGLYDHADGWSGMKFVSLYLFHFFYIPYDDLWTTAWLLVPNYGWGLKFDAVVCSSLWAAASDWEYSGIHGPQYGRPIGTVGQPRGSKSKCGCHF